MEKIQGLTVIFTGNGKGKTSSALGVVFRALGHGFKCKIIQFIKANKETGEYKFLQKLSPEVEIIQFGLGFTWLKDHTKEEHLNAVAEGLKSAKADLASGKYQLVVLDEILYAIRDKLLSLEDVVALVKSRPPETHLILTGRDAPKELVELADMVTSMEPIKHPMARGIPAQKGLDY
ncbi:MAG: cob(I)yrinic acid a,c-diamide adenosyltransferase [Nitrospinae bacterium]|nr:cob(I)yrinic acid a,c-diamide adenosyltransferase [Nitrospinota bacterium]